MHSREGIPRPISFDFEDALAEREAKGLAKGEAKGLAKGKAKERRKVALRMLKAKMSDTDIQQLTKLTKRELKLLKRGL